MAEQKPESEKERAKIILSSEKKKEAGTGGVRQYQTPIAILIGVVVIVGAILLTRSPQAPQDAPQATAILPSNTPAEVGTIQALETEKALLITPTVDPNILALQTQNAILAQNLTNQANAVQPTQAPQQPTEPPIIIVEPTQPPQIITATPQSQGNNTVQSSGCSRVGDEINVGATSSGPCATVSTSTVAGFLSQGLSFSDLISSLDRMCEANVDACYQYRSVIPNTIPASALPSQRILWGDLAYVSQAGLDGRIEKLKCSGNICVYLITDNQPFQVGNGGRGLLLDQSYALQNSVNNCPTNPSEVAGLIGGTAQYWSVLPNTSNTGWKYARGSPAITVTAPNFGHVDYHSSSVDNGRIENGQKAINVTEATFWCGG